MHAFSPSGPPDPTAVLGRRFLAAAVDLGIIWAFAATFWMLTSRTVPAGTRGGACTGRGLCSNVNDRYVAGWPMLLLLLVWLAYLVGVFVVQRGLTGRTVGTMLAGLVVVDEHGRPLGVGRAAIRSVAGVVDYIPCCLPIVGVVTILSTDAHRRVGDLAADSYVVGDDGFGHPVVLPGSYPPAPDAEVVYPNAYPAQPPTPAASAPPVATMPTAGPGASGPATAPIGGPVWDPQRQAYLQWDPDRGQWLQFDQATQEWQRYDTATGRWRAVER